MIGSARAVLNVPRVASEQSDLMVPESPFLSPRVPLTSGHTWRVNWFFGSNVTTFGRIRRSSVNPHLAKSRLVLSVESIVELSISTAHCLRGQN